MRKNKGFLELRRLEAARDIADQLSQGGNKVMLDSGTLLLDGMLTLFLSERLADVSASLSVTKESAKDLMAGAKK
jgi:hypothetical protein